MRDHMLHYDNQGLAIVWSCKATLGESADVEAYSLVVIGLVYKIYPDGCRRQHTFLLRLRPYPVREHWLLLMWTQACMGGVPIAVHSLFCSGKCRSFMSSSSGSMFSL